MLNGAKQCSDSSIEAVTQLFPGLVATRRLLNAPPQAISIATAVGIVTIRSLANQLGLVQQVSGRQFRVAALQEYGDGRYCSSFDRPAETSGENYVFNM